MATAAGAKKVYEDFSLIIPHHPLIERALADLKADQPLDPLVHDAKDGAAEALYGLGSAGSRQGDELPALDLSAIVALSSARRTI